MRPQLLDLGRESLHRTSQKHTMPPLQFVCQQLRKNLWRKRPKHSPEYHLIRVNPFVDIFRRVSGFREGAIDEADEAMAV